MCLICFSFLSVLFFTLSVFCNRILKLLIESLLCVRTAGHHWIKSRTIWQTPAAQVFSKDQLEQWAGLQSLVVVQSHRRLWHDIAETRYFLSSLSTDASSFARYICAHSGVENQLHWCLDMVFKEDASRIRKDHALQNMSLLRRLALNRLRQGPSKGSLAMKRYRAGLDDQFMLQILSANIPHSDARSQPDF